MSSDADRPDDPVPPADDPLPPPDDIEASPAGPAEPRTPPPDGVPVGELVELTPPAEVARAALNRARAAAAAKGIRPGQEPRRRSVLEPAPGAPGAHGRDPQLVGDSLSHLLRDRGWVQEVSVGGVVGRWRELVGAEIADHCVPETFEAGVLVVRTDSTSWAANLRLLVPQLLRRLADDVGEGVVVEVTVLGPAGPGFKKGRRSVPGRGPRDTWG